MSGRVAWIGITAGAAIMLSPFIGWLVAMPWDREDGQQPPPDRSPAWQAAYDACFEDNIRGFQARHGSQWTRDRIPDAQLGLFREQCANYADRIIG